MKIMGVTIISNNLDESLPYNEENFVYFEEL
jgi:hypothetical protein